MEPKNQNNKRAGYKVTLYTDATYKDDDTSPNKQYLIHLVFRYPKTRRYICLSWLMGKIGYGNLVAALSYIIGDENVKPLKDMKHDLSNHKCICTVSNVLSACRSMINLEDKNEQANISSEEHTVAE